MNAQLNVREAARALLGDVAGRNRILCPGPGHSRRDRSLSVTFTDNDFLVHSFAGDDFRECRDHVKAALGLSDGRPVAFNDNVPALDVDLLARKKTAADIWARSIRIAGTLAETYLQSRGLSYDGDALRFYPGGRAMVALITNAITGEPIGIHRTFLDRDGNRTSKKMLGAAAGGVVRLTPDEEFTGGLGVAEGIETALAVPFRPVWACLSAGQLAALPVLSGIEALTIFADQDKTGINAANTCGERWHSAGVEVTMAAPLQGDFADRRAA
jgi:putative DNA primase/helicase